VYLYDDSSTSGILLIRALSSRNVLNKRLNAASVSFELRTDSGVDCSTRSDRQWHKHGCVGAVLCDNNEQNRCHIRVQKQLTTTALLFMADAGRRMPVALIAPTKSCMAVKSVTPA